MGEVFRTTVRSMAMPFSVEVHGAGLGAAETAIERAVAAFHAELERANGTFSLWDGDSSLSRLNRGELTIDECPPEVLEVLQACEWYRAATEGGFDARRPDGLDPTGIVKGWAVERASRHLDAIGATAWMVGASGDVLVSAEGREWSIGIADPRVTGDPAGTPVIDVVRLGGRLRALATSGSAQHGDHIWDPATGAAASHFVQASVLAGDLVTADAWATAVVGAGERSLDAAVAAGLEVMVVTADRGDGTFSSAATPGWPSAIP